MKKTWQEKLRDKASFPKVLRLEKGFPCGYTQSLEMLSTVETYMTTSPRISTSQRLVTEIESYTTTSISKIIILDETVRLARWQTPAFIGCGYALLYTRTLEHNPLQVSYSVHKEHA